LNPDALWDAITSTYLDERFDLVVVVEASETSHAGRIYTIASKRILSYSDQPGEGLVDDKKNSVNHSGGGPNDDDSCGPGGGPTNDDNRPRQHRHQAGLRCLSMVGFTSARFAT
jgi:hypothetical protein